MNTTERILWMSLCPAFFLLLIKFPADITGVSILIAEFDGSNLQETSGYK
jgi:hypothetical protein